tara:strand:+ start:2281 stop:3210 length:930 start_codon:yes stop_codon:yes gene_type:complete
MKNKLLSLASLLAVLNANAIEIGPTGSGVEMSGFIDLYYQSGDTDAVGVGQVEIDFDYASGPVSASVDFDLGGDFADADNLEEAIITYDFGNGFSVTAGEMLTYMGFEAYDPINMYQYSSAYADSLAVAGYPHIYDAFATGASVDYATDSFSVGIWSSIGESADFEYALAYTGIENLTIKAILADYGTNSTGPFDGKSTYWASYQFGKLLVAAEIANAEAATAANDELDGSLIMANYAITDSAAVTFRYSVTEVESGGVKTVDETKLTISPSYVFNDNLSGLVEYSTFDQDGTAAETEDYFAAELIYTF